MLSEERRKAIEIFEAFEDATKDKREFSISDIEKIIGPLGCCLDGLVDQSDNYCEKHGHRPVKE
jgi:hypothetical protein